MADDPITTDLTRFVRTLSTAHKSLLLYSLAHPRGREGANGAYDLLAILLDRLPEISLGVAEGPRRVVGAPGPGPGALVQRPKTGTFGADNP